MKRNNVICSLVVAAVVLIGISIIAAKVYAQSNQPRPRFVQIYQEPHTEISTRLTTIEVWRDRETGQETICYFNYRGMSCVLTGRAWSGN